MREYHLKTLTNKKAGFPPRKKEEEELITQLNKIKKQKFFNEDKVNWLEQLFIVIKCPSGFAEEGNRH